MGCTSSSLRLMQTPVLDLSEVSANAKQRSAHLPGKNGSKTDCYFSGKFFLDFLEKALFPRLFAEVDDLSELAGLAEANSVFRKIFQKKKSEAVRQSKKNRRSRFVSQPHCSPRSNNGENAWELAPKAKVDPEQLILSLLFHLKYHPEDSNLWYRIGKCYSNLSDYKDSNAKAFDCFKKAVEMEHVEALIKLGVCYHVGIGTQVDNIKAFSCFLDAAERGNTDGYAQLSVCYMEGIGTSANYDQAFFWAQKAFEGGHRLGKYLLSKLTKKTNPS